MMKDAKVLQRWRRADGIETAVGHNCCMVKVTIQPTCRYEHGPLKPIEGDWALVGYDERPMSAEMREMLNERGGKLFKNTYADQNGRNYGVKIFKCSSCGYLELFDPDDD